MSESMDQQLLDKIQNLLFAIQILHDEVITMILPFDVQEHFLERYGIGVGYLRYQRNVLILAIAYRRYNFY